jgi:hypothetical protein
MHRVHAGFSKTPYRRFGVDTALSVFGDGSEQRAALDGAAVAHLDLGQDAGDRSANFMGDVVGVDLDHGLVAADGIAADSLTSDFTTVGTRISAMAWIPENGCGKLAGARRRLWQNPA